jgi:CHAD domain-containing protein
MYRISLGRKSSPANGPRNIDPNAVLASSVSAAYAQWQEAWATALSSFTPSELHAFRMQTKRLRYPIELLRDIGSTTAPAALVSLKKLQDELGHWHDNVELATITARALNNPQFLVHYPRSATAMLRRMDRENARHLTRIQQLLSDQPPGEAVSPHYDLIGRCCGQVSPGNGKPPDVLTA